MYCGKCGQELAEGAKFCAACGAVTEQAAQQGKSNKRQVLLIAKIALLVGMVAFFFPFASVSCSSYSVTASGAELMTTISFDEEVTEAFEDYGPNVFLIVSFAAAIAALVLLFTRPNQAAWVIVAVAFVALIVFRMSFVGYYDLSDSVDYVDIDFRWGWWLSLLAWAATAVCAYLQARLPEGASREVAYAGQS